MCQNPIHALDGCDCLICTVELSQFGGPLNEGRNGGDIIIV
jgi:hypothetical protein